MSEMYASSRQIVLSRFNLFSDSERSDSSQNPEIHSRIESLVSRAKNGEGEAFAALYREYAEQIFRYIYFRVRQAEQTEDLTQEVFLKAFHNIVSYNYEGKSFVSWLFRIAHNLIIDYYRQSNKKRCVPLRESIPSAEDPMTDVEQRMGLSMVKRSIEGLPPRQKEIISLRFGAELSITETARVVGITEGSVKKLQHEAMLKLKRLLEEKMSDTSSRVSGLFLDYDGTISPLNVPRQQSRISPQLEKLLYIIRNTIPIGIVTTKDLSFILPRTRFARAWSAIAGLEMKTDSCLLTSQEVKKTLPSLNQALVFSKQILGSGGMIEEKCDSQGRPLAFCVDWRQTKDTKEARKMAEQILVYCKELQLKTIEYPGKPFYDVFPCSISKGKALRKLKRTLKIFGGIIYMGDSITDNQAFKEADISIGVTEEKKPVGLRCRYWIKFDEVALFLNSLNENRLTFSPDLPGIRMNV